MTRQDDVRNLIRNHNRRLQKLREQQALHGLDVATKILLEIEDIEAEIEQRQAELKEIENDVRSLPQRVEQQRQRIAEGLTEIRQQAAEKTQTSPTKERLQVVGQPPMGVVEHFKDRLQEREKIGQLLAEPTTRLVSVIGHGGMGKTALASKILRDLEQDRWPHTDGDIPLNGIVYLSTRTAGISLELHQEDPFVRKIISGTMDICQSALSKTAGLYEWRYILATALVENAICDPAWKEVSRRSDLLAPALAEYQKALEVCDAPGVIREVLHNLELIRAADIEGLEPVFKLLEAKLDQ